MQKIVGLVRTASLVIHQFEDKKNLTTLCGYKFGVNETILWGSPSRVNCEECQQISHQKMLDQLNLNNEVVNESKDDSEVYNCR